MAYKNSGAMKFNDATDLVIRADPSGTVESCYNLADNTEYIDPRFIPPVNYTVVINNNSSSTKTIYFPIINASGRMEATRNAVNSGASLTITVFKNGFLTTTVVTPVTVVSGDITVVSTTQTLINSDGEINFTD